MALLTPVTTTEPAHLTALSRRKDTATKKTSTESSTPAGAAEYASALHHLDLEHRKLRTGFADHLGLTHNEYDAFMFIVEQHTTTPKDLAATLRFTTGATTAMIDRLENADLVHRIPNPTDRRSVLIEPTPYGQAQAGWLIDTYTHTTMIITAATESISDPA